MVRVGLSRGFKMKSAKDHDAKLKKLRKTKNIRTECRSTQRDSNGRDAIRRCKSATHVSFSPRTKQPPLSSQMAARPFRVPSRRNNRLVASSASGPNYSESFNIAIAMCATITRLCVSQSDKQTHNFILFSMFSESSN